MLPNSAAGALGEEKDDEGWVDQTTQTVSNTVITTRGTVSELLDMNALEERRREQDDVVERMRVEETKAALAAAREGMEKEAQRLKDKQEKKNMKEASVNSNNDSASASNGGKWVPVHKRTGVSPALGNSRLMMNKARGKSSLPDTEDAMDFPDLAAANAAIEAQKKQEKERQEKERQRAAAKTSGMKPWGASRSTISSGTGETRKKIQVLPPSSSKTVSSTTEPAKPVPEPSKSTSITSEKVTTKTESITTPVSSSNPVAQAPVAPPKPAAPATTTKTPVVKKKKKKKKDLSTFNAA